MFLIFRNAVVIAAIALIVIANIFLDLANPWIAAAVSVTVAIAFWILVERFRTRRATSEMRRLYGKDWG